jgi:hypothetical protein
MRTVLVVFCALLVMSASMEAKRKVPAVQKTTLAKAHRKAVKQIVKSRKAPKRRQRVN